MIAWRGVYPSSVRPSSIYLSSLCVYPVDEIQSICDMIIIPWKKRSTFALRDDYLAAY